MKLDSSINIDVSEFFTWWLEQLQGLIPKKIRSSFLSPQSYLLCSVDQHNARLLLRSSDEEEQQEQSVTVDELTRLADVLLKFPPSSLTSKKVLLLKPGQYLRKELILPAAAAENLQQVAGFEMDRLTPFKTDQVYFQANVIEKMPTMQLRVALILIPKQKLNVLLEEMGTFGFIPEVIDIEESLPAKGRYKPAYNLLPQDHRSGGMEWSKIVPATLALILLLLVVANVALPLVRENSEIERLRDELDRVSQVAMKVDNLKKDADQLLEETNFLLEKKRTEPVMVDVLNELTSLLPDDTWLTSLRFNDGKLQIQGNSPSASQLIEVIEASPVFENTRFVSPVTQNNRSKVERFQIETIVKARPESVSEPE